MSVTALVRSDRVLQKTALSFDASVWELVSPLSSGATLVVAPAAVAGDVGGAGATVGGGSDQRGAAGAVAVGGAAGGGRSLSAARSLRLVFCGGEALPPALAARFRERLPWAALHNLYGPSEATIDATAWACGAAADGDAVLPIGVTDLRGFGLCFGRWSWVGSGRGLLGSCIWAGLVWRGVMCGRGGLTASRFIADRHGGVGGRLYRTGDLARRRWMGCWSMSVGATVR